MSKLSKAIQELYDDMSDVEANHASYHLVSLFEVLQTVESRLAHEKSSELDNEHNRSTN